MTERNDAAGGGYALPVLAVVSLAAALFVHREETFVLTRGKAAGTNVANRESRLWHDPLDKTALATLEEFQPSKQKAELALLVTVPSSDSFEDAESRSNTRQAVHSAMTACGYAPEDATKLRCVRWVLDDSPEARAAAGMFRSKDPSQIAAAAADKNGKEDASGGKAPDSKQEEPPQLPIPVESFASAGVTVLVFWLPERQLMQAFGDSWAEQTRPRLEAKAKADKVILVGPSSTYALEHTSLAGLHVHSPWVTGTSKAAEANWQQVQQPADGALPVRRSFICKDVDLAKTLKGELNMRGVTRADRVLLVMERDSSFARGWRDHLSKAWQEPAENQESNGEDGAAKKTGESTQPAPGASPASGFAEAWYSRGIDADEVATEATGKQVEIEKPVGKGTLDYLRRLRREFRRQHTMNEIEAVGIFGQDIHDKLLIMQVLRPAFPEAVFFTSDLHAFYTHPTQLPHTRNLIVASGHGLLPKPHDHSAPTADGHDHSHHHSTAPVTAATAKDASGAPPGPVPAEGILTPFRDSYQTSTYLAVHAALCRHPVVCDTRGTVFEVGSDGVLELPVQGWSPGLSLGAWLWTGLALLGILMSGALVHWWLAGGRWARRKPAVEKGNRGWQVGILLVVALCTTVWISTAMSGEPAKWTGGISAWPSELLRLLALTLSLVFAYHVIRSLRGATTGALGGRVTRVAARPLAVVLFPIVGAALRAIFRPVVQLVRRDAPTSPAAEPVAARRLGRIAGAWRWLASPGDTPWQNVHRKCVGALLMAVLLMLFGVLIIWCLGWPHTPIRGTWARFLDKVLLFSSILAMLWLVFLVIEAARQYVALCRSHLRDVPSPEAPVVDLERWRTHRRFLSDLASAGGKGIYGPFIVIFLMCLSRWHGFDDWTWPLGLKIVVGLSGGFVLLAHIYLHRVAVGLRERTIASLKVANEDVTDRELGGRLEQVLNDLKRLDRGIFAGLTGHPVMRGLVIPFTGIGGLSVLHYLQAV